MSEIFSGRLLLRIDGGLHRELFEAARARRMSVNALCGRLIEQGLHLRETPPWWQGDADRIATLVRKKFGRHAHGVLLFGSRVEGTATDESDIDVLIVVGDAVPLRRDLYRWWDESVQPHVDRRVNPQFAHLPALRDEVGGLWYEVAMTSRVVWERGRKLSSVLSRIKDDIANDLVRRYWSHGQPYWVRRDDEKQGSRA